ncbi:MAG TPA: RimK family alpha-L-glutamate ligase [Pseudolabrys sp.]|nr:RimK family alpha-L-glutamate ligase [Pseudolabrys sp.]
MNPSPESAVSRIRAPAATVAIVTDANDWHARSLAKAFAALGVRTKLLALADCRIDTTRANALTLPAFAANLPDAVLVRDMAGGTFEAVTLRLGILHALSELKIPVWNSARAIERCVDKSMTSFLLTRAGLPTPQTWAMESRESAAAIVEGEPGPLVLKPLFGSQGRGLRLIRTVEDLPGSNEVSGVYYLQRFVSVEHDGFHDFRVLVSRGRVVAAMMRHSSHWVTNVKRGGRPVAAVIDQTMKDMAVAATAAVGADFAGVDITYDRDGRPSVLEVNSMPAWSGLQRTTPIDIAAALAGDLTASLAMRARQGA